MLTIGFAAVWDAYISFINFYYAIHSEVIIIIFIFIDYMK